MRFFFKIIPILIVFIAAYSFVLGQDATIRRSETIEKNGGKKFYVHTVESSQTLFAIARAYEIEISEIIIENPDALSGLSVGQKLKVPYRASKYPQVESDFLLHKVEKGETFFSISKKYGVLVQEIQDLNGNTLNEGQIIKISLASIKNKDEFISSSNSILPKELGGDEKQKMVNADGKLHHTIAKKETLFSISKLYGVGTDEILHLNPELEKGFKVGQQIQIPYANTLNQSVKEVKLDISKNKKEYYNIAVLLPFSIASVDSTTSIRAQMFDENGELDKKALVAVDFYLGTKIALDSLNTMGFKMKVTVYDTDRSVEKIREILRNPDFQTTDFIIGPLYSSYFKEISDFAKAKKIGIVAPMSKSSSIIEGNSHVSKFLPPVNANIKNLANYIKDNYKTGNVLIVSDADTQLKTNASLFYKQIYFSDSTTKKFSVKQIDYVGFTSITQNLSQNLLNIIFFPTNNPVIMSRLLTDLSSRKEKILLIGDESWMELNLIPDQMRKLNIHLIASSNVDYERDEVKQFVKVFREQFLSEPSEYSFLGFDITLNYLKLLNEKGVTFYNNLDLYNQKGLQHDFKFRRALKNNGFENQSSVILIYQDYEFRKAQ